MLRSLGSKWLLAGRRLNSSVADGGRISFAGAVKDLTRKDEVANISNPYGEKRAMKGKSLKFL